MHIHVLGVCGTFMAGIAILAKQMGYRVTGSDDQHYPPMNIQLAKAKIPILSHQDLLTQLKPDLLLIGNKMRRGDPILEYALNENFVYMSGPQWLASQVLAKRWVLAVAGTHGKTTTSSILAWILAQCDKQPGFLIGGIPESFEQSAQLGKSPFFVVEADEYDSAFFDKRSKFIHYRPRTLILNNLEYDHADIFPNLSAIKQQFHHLIRTIPGKGMIIAHGSDRNLSAVMKQGCWSNCEFFALKKGDWTAKPLLPDGSRFIVYYHKRPLGEVAWQLVGLHNVSNALAAIAAAFHAGIPANDSVNAVCKFKGVQRRLQVKGCVDNITLYDDFAHHPTAIRATLNGLRQRVGKQARMYVVLQLGSYSMRMGVHQNALPLALAEANHVYLLKEGGVHAKALAPTSAMAETYECVADLVKQLCARAKSGDHIIVMSNKDVTDIHQQLLTGLANR